VVKDLERNTAQANHVWEQKEKLEQSLQVQTHRISWEGRPSNDHNNESLILILKVQSHDS